MRLNGLIWPLAASAGLLAGCAGPEVPPPREELARAELAIEQAMLADANSHAPVVLQEARQHLGDARIAMERQQYLEATRLAEKAETDAQLALAESQARESEQLAQETLRGVETLREELERQEVQR